MHIWLKQAQGNVEILFKNNSDRPDMKNLAALVIMKLIN